MTIAISHEPTTEGWRIYKDGTHLIGVLHTTHSLGRVVMTQHKRPDGSLEQVGVRDVMPPEACQLYFTNPQQNLDELKAVIAHVEKHKLVTVDPAGDDK